MVQVDPMSREGVVGGVGPAGVGQRGDEHGLQRDEDLAEGGLLHQTLQMLEVDTHAQFAGVVVYLGENKSNKKSKGRTRFFFSSVASEE